MYRTIDKVLYLTKVLNEQIESKETKNMKLKASEVKRSRRFVLLKYMTSSEAESHQKLAPQKLQYITRSKMIQDLNVSSVVLWNVIHIRVEEDHMEVT